MLQFLFQYSASTITLSLFRRIQSYPNPLPPFNLLIEICVMDWKIIENCEIIFFHTIYMIAAMSYIYQNKKCCLDKYCWKITKWHIWCKDNNVTNITLYLQSLEGDICRAFLFILILQRSISYHIDVHFLELKMQYIEFDIELYVLLKFFNLN